MARPVIVLSSPSPRCHKGHRILFFHRHEQVPKGPPTTEHFGTEKKVTAERDPKKNAEDEPKNEFRRESRKRMLDRI